MTTQRVDRCRSVSDTTPKLSGALGRRVPADPHSMDNVADGLAGYRRQEQFLRQAFVVRRFWVLADPRVWMCTIGARVFFAMIAAIVGLLTEDNDFVRRVILAITSVAFLA